MYNAIVTKEKQQKQSQEEKKGRIFPGREQATLKKKKRARVRRREGSKFLLN